MGRKQVLRIAYLIAGVVFFASCAVLGALIVLYGAGVLAPSAGSCAVEAAGVLGITAGVVACESLEAARR